MEALRMYTVREVGLMMTMTGAPARVGMLGLRSVGTMGDASASTSARLRKCHRTLTSTFSQAPRELTSHSLLQAQRLGSRS